MLVDGEEYDEDEDDDDSEADVCDNNIAKTKLHQSNVARRPCNAIKPAAPARTVSMSSTFRSKLDNVFNSVS